MSAFTLRIRDLRLGFKDWSGSFDVLHGISMHIKKGERVALVGESGSGKSVTARIILGLLHSMCSSSISGLVEFEGQDLSQLPDRQRQALRGTRMSMIFQDPTSSLNPVFPISVQFREVLKRMSPSISEQAARQRAEQALADMSIPDPVRVLDSYSFQLSGGMNQRVMIAMALANEPSLLIADEPGTALDVTVQAQTLHLMAEQVDRHSASVLFISHNLGVVHEFADRVYVIYKGRIVEQGPTAALFETPLHPYTRALLSALPRITGGGIADVEDASEEYFAPLAVHQGYGEEDAV